MTGTTNSHIRKKRTYCRLDRLQRRITDLRGDRAMVTRELQLSILWLKHTDFVHECGELWLAEPENKDPVDFTDLGLTMAEVNNVCSRF